MCRSARVPGPYPSWKLSDPEAVAAVSSGVVAITTCADISVYEADADSVLLPAAVVAIADGAGASCDGDASHSGGDTTSADSSNTGSSSDTGNSDSDSDSDSSGDSDTGSDSARGSGNERSGPSSTGASVTTTVTNLSDDVDRRRRRRARKANNFQCRNCGKVLHSVAAFDAHELQHLEDMIKASQRETSRLRRLAKQPS